MEYHIFKTSLVFSFDDERDNITVNESDENYNKIKKLLNGKSKNKLKTIEKLINTPMNTITEAISEVKGFSINKNVITYNGDAVEPFFGSKILEFRNAKKPYEYLLKFYERVNQNPSTNSRKQLFKFLTHNEFPFTEDGCFIAFKSIKQNFTDHHSGKMDCSIGTIAEMPREQVQDDPNSACSTGLHIGTFKFANDFGGNNNIMVAVLVDPKDVVSVPHDSHHQKCRCCRYKILKTITAPFPKDQVVIISDTEKALNLPSTKKTKPKTKTISTEASIDIINKIKYKINNTDQTELDSIKENVAIQPSKRMQFFKDIKEVIKQMWKVPETNSFYVKTNKDNVVSYVPVKSDTPIETKKVVSKSKKKVVSKSKEKKDVCKKNTVIITKKLFKVSIIKEGIFKKVKDLKSIKPSARNAYFKSLEVIERMWKNKTEFYILMHDGKYVRYTPVKK